MEIVDRKLKIDRTKVAAAMYSFVTTPLAKLMGEKPERAVVVGRPLAGGKKKPDPNQTAKRGKGAPPKRLPFEYLLCKGGELSKAEAKSQSEPILRGDVLR
jgi:hypothetical protein